MSIKPINCLRHKNHDVIITLRSLYKVWIFSNPYALMFDTSCEVLCVFPQVGIAFKLFWSIHLSNAKLK